MGFSLSPEEIESGLQREIAKLNREIVAAKAEIDRWHHLWEELDDDYSSLVLDEARLERENQRLTCGLVTIRDYPQQAGSSAAMRHIADTILNPKKENR